MNQSAPAALSCAEGTSTMTQEPRKHPAGEHRPKRGESQREGDHVAGRRSQAAGRSFAENESAGAASDPHVDENLDRDLNETFPASDPISISPGAD
jgi:hypothetical protein